MKYQTILHIFKKKIIPVTIINNDSVMVLFAKYNAVKHAIRDYYSIRDPSKIAPYNNFHTFAPLMRDHLSFKTIILAMWDNTGFNVHHIHPPAN